MLLFVTIHPGQYTSVMEHTEKAIAHTLNSICQIEASFSYSQYNLTTEQAKQLLKQTTPSLDCDSDDGNVYHVLATEILHSV